jgi:hypothetical protein
VSADERPECRSQPLHVEFAFDADDTPAAESMVRPGLLQQPDVLLLRREPKTFKHLFAHPCFRVTAH